MAQWTQIWEECDCEVSSRYIHDEPGEDCNAWAAYQKAKEGNGPCNVCGKMSMISIALHPLKQAAQ